MRSVPGHDAQARSFFLAAMTHFRRLMIAAILAGSLAGLLLFAVQHFTIIPLIDTAERFEEAAAHAGHNHAPGEHAHEDEGWQPAPGFQRVSLTALTTLLSGIGFAAVLLAAMSPRVPPRPTLLWGVLWGLAGFTCFILAPALGLPPRPPGAVMGDLHARQLWWTGTVLATAAGLWVITSPGKAWWIRAAGLTILLLPHLLGAPGPNGTPDGADVIPPALLRDFLWMSLATNLLFWLALGALCGFLWGRQSKVRAASGPPI